MPNDSTCCSTWLTHTHTHTHCNVSAMSQQTHSNISAQTQHISLLDTYKPHRTHPPITTSTSAVMKLSSPTRLAVSAERVPPQGCYVTRLLQLNKCPETHILPREVWQYPPPLIITSTLTSHDPDYHQNLISFFHGPHVTFPPNFVKMGRAVFCVILLTKNKQTNKHRWWKHNPRGGSSKLTAEKTDG